MYRFDRNKPTLEFEILNRDDVIAHITIYPSHNEAEYFTDFFLDRPFGGVSRPTDDNIANYYTSRCIPKSRGNIKQILPTYNLNTYDALDLIRVTHGVMYEDFEWIRFKGEELTWDDVRIR